MKILPISSSKHSSQQEDGGGIVGNRNFFHYSKHYPSKISVRSKYATFFITFHVWFGIMFGLGTSTLNSFHNFLRACLHQLQIVLPLADTRCSRNSSFITFSCVCGYIYLYSAQETSFIIYLILFNVWNLINLAAHFLPGYLLISCSSNLSFSSLLLYLCSCCNIFYTLIPPISGIPSGILIRSSSSSWWIILEHALIISSGNWLDQFLCCCFILSHLHFILLNSVECKKLASNWSSSSFLIVHTLGFLEVMIYFWLSWNETCLCSFSNSSSSTTQTRIQKVN